MDELFPDGPPAEGEGEEAFSFWGIPPEAIWAALAVILLTVFYFRRNNNTTTNHPETVASGPLGRQKAEPPIDADSIRQARLAKLQSLQSETKQKEAPKATTERAKDSDQPSQHQQPQPKPQPQHQQQKESKQQQQQLDEQRKQLRLQRLQQAHSKPDEPTAADEEQQVPARNSENKSSAQVAANSAATPPLEHLPKEKRSDTPPSVTDDAPEWTFDASFVTTLGLSGTMVVRGGVSVGELQQKILEQCNNENPELIQSILVPALNAVLGESSFGFFEKVRDTPLTSLESPIRFQVEYVRSATVAPGDTRRLFEKWLEETGNKKLEMPVTIVVQGGSVASHRLRLTVQAYESIQSVQLRLLQQHNIICSRIMHRGRNLQPTSKIIDHPISSGDVIVALASPVSTQDAPTRSVRWDRIGGGAFVWSGVREGGSNTWAEVRDAPNSKVCETLRTMRNQKGNLRQTVTQWLQAQGVEILAIFEQVSVDAAGALVIRECSGQRHIRLTNQGAYLGTGPGNWTRICDGNWWTQPATQSPQLSPQILTSIPEEIDQDLYGDEESAAPPNTKPQVADEDEEDLYGVSSEEDK